MPGFLFMQSTKTSEFPAEGKSNSVLNLKIKNKKFLIVHIHFITLSKWNALLIKLFCRDGIVNAYQNSVFCQIVYLMKKVITLVDRKFNIRVQAEYKEYTSPDLQCLKWFINLICPWLSNNYCIYEKNNKYIFCWKRI